MSLLRVSLFGLICLFFLNACSMGDRSNDLLVGTPAPDVVLPSTDGSSSSVISARSGGNAVLVFWASWCPNCREELALINRHLSEIKAKGITVILVNEGETPEEVKAYLSMRRIGLASFLDEENVLQEPYHINGIPTLVFINAQGLIVGVTHSLPSDYESIF